MSPNKRICKVALRRMSKERDIHSAEQTKSENTTDGNCELMGGTQKVRFVPVHSNYQYGLDDEKTEVQTLIQCITAMEEYQHHSLEELRYFDYTSTAFSTKPSQDTELNFMSNPGNLKCPLIDLTKTDDSVQNLSKAKHDVPCQQSVPLLQYQESSQENVAGASLSGELGQNLSKAKHDVLCQQSVPLLQYQESSKENVAGASLSGCQYNSRLQPAQDFSRNALSEPLQSPGFASLLTSKVCLLTDLQISLCDQLVDKDVETRETMCWLIVNELQISRDEVLYKTMPCNLLCLEVTNREKLTKQLMKLLNQVQRNIHLASIVTHALIDEFGFIGQLKRLLLVKAAQVGNEVPVVNGRRWSGTTSKSKSSCHYSLNKERKSQIGLAVGQAATSSEPRETRVCLSDSHAKLHLKNDGDVLVLSEPGKLFRFQVVSGDQFLECWKEQGTGMINLFQNEEAKCAKVVVYHWAAHRSYSTIIFRQNMKIKFMPSSDGHVLKFMGIEVSECQEKMRYFLIQFENEVAAQSFKNLILSIPFLNASVDEKPETTYCLEVKFKSHHILEEFPSCLSESRKLDPEDFSVSRSLLINSTLMGKGEISLNPGMQNSYSKSKSLYDHNSMKDDECELNRLDKDEYLRMDESTTSFDICDINPKDDCVESLEIQTHILHNDLSLYSEAMKPLNLDKGESNESEDNSCTLVSKTEDCKGQVDSDKLIFSEHRNSETDNNCLISENDESVGKDENRSSFGLSILEADDSVAKGEDIEHENDNNKHANDGGVECLNDRQQNEVDVEYTINKDEKHLANADINRSDDDEDIKHQICEDNKRPTNEDALCTHLDDDNLRCLHEDAKQSVLKDKSEDNQNASDEHNSSGLPSEQMPSSELTINA